jgi:dihydropteroate synthase
VRNGQRLETADRLYGTLGAEVAAALKGAHIIRTHDVKACVEALRLADIAG